MANTFLSVYRMEHLTSRTSCRRLAMAAFGFKPRSANCEPAHLSMPAKGAMCPRCSAWWCKDELTTLGCRRCIERTRVKWTLQKVLPKCVGAIVFEHLWLANEFSLAKERRAGYCAHDHRCRCRQCRGMPGSERGRRRIVHRWRVLSLRTRTRKMSSPEFECPWVGCGCLVGYFVFGIVEWRECRGGNFMSILDVLK